MNLRATTPTSTPTSSVPRNNTRNPKPRAISCDLVKSSNHSAARGYPKAATTKPITTEAREISSWTNPFIMAVTTEATTIAARMQSSQFHAPMARSQTAADLTLTEGISGQQTISFAVFLTRLLHHLGGQGRWRGLFIPMERLQVVADKLLVKRRLGSSRARNRAAARIVRSRESVPRRSR